MSHLDDLRALIKRIEAEPEELRCNEYLAALTSFHIGLRHLECRDARRRACGMKDGDAERGAPQHI